MGIRSMTGFGRGSARQDRLKVEIELSAVNKKQLDVVVHLPRALQTLETRIEDELSHRISRGRVTVNAAVRQAARAPRRVRLDAPLAHAYVAALRGAARAYRLRDDLGVSALLALPDVLTVEHPEEDAEKVWPALRAALQRALAALLRMRAAEGRELQRDLARRFDLLAAHVDRIAARAPDAVRRYRETLTARLRAGGFEGGEHADRVAREIALFAERGDIAEELTRLRSHFKQARSLLRSRDAAGRALDFLAQEMFREINTVGSKSSDAAIAAEVVHFKAELERIREQVQNVE